LQHTPVIPALGRLRQEGQEFEASLGYTAIPYLKKKWRYQHDLLVYMSVCVDKHTYVSI
jgi:hypothetical protein